ncbi:bacteriophage Gp15 protein [Peptoanaerobacter stomatis]|uniref:Bacteriophage Gp15 protein n=1 Tax=Peptoanaerobacter stomatis TaxID=796937 RepID=J6HIQ5_9FIRM|nr:bacteriophage Gp15 protein [Peptoanaerobacter stomatis]
MFEQLMKDNSVNDDAKIELALNLYFPKQYIINTVDAVNKIIWFYSGGKEIKDSGGKTSNSGKNVNIYDFEQDADYIYAAFMEQYKIDLADIDYLHWWKFKSLFYGLNKDIQLSKIMFYRSVELTDDMTKNERKFYRDMKRLYALEDMRSEEEKEQDFNDCLAGMF